MIWLSLRIQDSLEAENCTDCSTTTASALTTLMAYAAYLVIVQHAIGDGTRQQCSHPTWIQPMCCITIADSSLLTSTLPIVRQ